MSVERDIMIDALKTIVIPELREKGFKGSFPHFRRNTDEKIDLLTFQFDKYGGGLRLEIAENVHHKVTSKVLKILKKAEEYWSNMEYH